MIPAPVPGAVSQVNATDDDDEQPVQLTRPVPGDIKKIVSQWPKIINLVRNPVQSFLKKSSLSLSDDDRLIITTKDPFAYEYLMKDMAAEELNRTFTEVMGGEVDYEVILKGEGKGAGRKFPDLSKINMEITMDDSDTDEY